MTFSTPWIRWRLTIRKIFSLFNIEIAVFVAKIAVCVEIRLLSTLDQFFGQVSLGMAHSEAFVLANLFRFTVLSLIRCRQHMCLNHSYPKSLEDIEYQRRFCCILNIKHLTYFTKLVSYGGSRNSYPYSNRAGCSRRYVRSRYHQVDYHGIFRYYKSS